MSGALCALVLTHHSCMNPTQGMEDPLVDWAHGGQPLHVIYLVHRFLDLLKQRHAQSFSLLFFSRMEQCWRGSRLVMRTALIRYLRTASPHVNVVTDLESVWDPRYESLIQLQQPAYVTFARLLRYVDVVRDCSLVCC